MKKVVIIGTSYPYKGGLAAYNERLAKEFSNQGMETFIHTFTLQYPSMLYPGKTQFSGALPPENLRIKRSINSINPLTWKTAGRQISSEMPDLAIIKYWLPFMAPCLGTIARTIKKQSSCKVISIADNILPHEKRPLDNLLTKYFINSVDGFIVMSSQVDKDLKSFDPLKPSRFSPHPLYDNYGDPVEKAAACEYLGLPPDDRYLLFFGIIRDYKGLDLLLNAMNIEKVMDLGIKLIVAGEFYTDSKPYLDYINGNHLNNVILRTGFIPDNEVGKYFCAADLVVQPYKHATQSGITQIAYHFNKPMIVTNVGGLPELVHDGKVGFVVNPDPEEIADAVCSFYLEKKEKYFIQQIGLEKKKFSWKYLVENILDFSASLSK